MTDAECRALSDRLDSMVAVGVIGYVSRWATCKDPATFRRAKECGAKVRYRYIPEAGGSTREVERHDPIFLVRFA